MIPFFSTPERVARLDAAAALWIGTPFINYGAVKGSDGGASCSCLVAAILNEAGFDVGEEMPRVRPGWAQRRAEDVMLPWLRDRHAKFNEVKPALSNILPGDVVVSNLNGLCAHHVGVAISGGSIVHTLRGSGAHKTGLSDPAAKAIVAIFRPIE